MGEMIFYSRPWVHVHKISQDSTRQTRLLHPMPGPRDKGTKVQGNSPSDDSHSQDCLKGLSALMKMFYVLSSMWPLCTNMVASVNDKLNF